MHARKFDDCRTIFRGGTYRTNVRKTPMQRCRGRTSSYDRRTTVVSVERLFSLLQKFIKCCTTIYECWATQRFCHTTLSDHLLCYTYIQTKNWPFLARLVVRLSCNVVQVVQQWDHLDGNSGKKKYDFWKFVRLFGSYDVGNALWKPLKVRKTVQLICRLNWIYSWRVALFII